MPNPAKPDDHSKANSENATDRTRLFDRIEEVNRSWLDRMRELRTVEADFSAKLFASGSPQEAMAICNQWMAKRLEILGTEQQVLAKTWVEIIGLVSESAKTTFQKAGSKTE